MELNRSSPYILYGHVFINYPNFAQGFSLAGGKESMYNGLLPTHT